MKHKLQIAAFALMIFAAVTFCSCRARPSLKINCFDLPADMQLKVLVRLDEADSDFVDKAKSGYDPFTHNLIAETQLDSGTDSSADRYSMSAEENYRLFLKEISEIGNEHLYYYNEDGWRSADYYMWANTYTENNRFFVPSSYTYTRDFVEEYSEFRLAVVDGSGRVHKVSNIADMTPEDKFAVYTELDYSYESNMLTPSNITYRRVNGKAPDSYLLLFALIAIGCDLCCIALLTVMFAAYNTGNNHRSVGYVLGFISLSLGNILFTLNKLTLELVPKFDLECDGLTSKDITSLISVDALWLVEVAVFVFLICRPKKMNIFYERKY